MRNYHGNHLSRGTHIPPPKNEPYIKHLFLGKCGCIYIFFNKLKQVKVERVMWRGRKTGRWEGHRLSSVSGVLENNGISSSNPSCTRTHAHTLLDSTLWICSWPFRPLPFYTSLTSFRRMRAPPGRRRKPIWPCLLSLRVLACHTRSMRQETMKGPSCMLFLFIEAPSTKGSAGCWFSLTTKVFFSHL